MKYRPFKTTQKGDLNMLPAGLKKTVKVRSNRTLRRRIKEASRKMDGEKVFLAIGYQY
jgi:hypothetical protein